MIPNNPPAQYHTKLIQHIIEYLDNNEPYKSQKGNLKLLIDDPAYNTGKPQKINGSIPDIFCKTLTGYELIGEAKPGKDFTNENSTSYERTIKQIHSYIKYINDKNKSEFILCTDYIGARKAKEILNFYGSKYSTLNKNYKVIEFYEV